MDMNPFINHHLTNNVYSVVAHGQFKKLSGPFGKGGGAKANKKPGIWNKYYWIIIIAVIGVSVCICIICVVMLWKRKAQRDREVEQHQYPLPIQQAMQNDQQFHRANQNVSYRHSAHHKPASQG